MGESEENLLCWPAGGCAVKIVTSWFCGDSIGSDNEVNDEGAIGAWGARVGKDGGVCLVKIFELVFLREKS